MNANTGGYSEFVTVILAVALVVATFSLVGKTIKGVAKAIDRGIHTVEGWLVHLSRAPHRPFPESVSGYLQAVVGGVFFCFFVFQLQLGLRWNARGKWVAILTIVAACGIALAVYGHKSRRYKEKEYGIRLSGLLYYHRHMKPLADWVAFQSYALLWLDHLPILHPVIGALDAVANRINHWRWRVFLRCLFVFSLFTLPVKLFETIDNGVKYGLAAGTTHLFPGAVQAFRDSVRSAKLERSKDPSQEEVQILTAQQLPEDSQNEIRNAVEDALGPVKVRIERSSNPMSGIEMRRKNSPPFTQRGSYYWLWSGGMGAELQPWLQGIAIVYLYLFDWWFTILVLYTAVAILSPTEPRNLFPGVGDAVLYFVVEHEIFKFARYFWRDAVDSYSPFPDPKMPASPWDDFAQSLHEETVRLDNTFLACTWQGVNSRVAAVFEEAGGHETCFHYRRFGACAYVIAVDERPERFAGAKTDSQVDFQHLSESIGCLVNVRNSLKYNTPQFVNRITG